MAMLHARKAKRDDGTRLPAFVLETDNLDSYRPWLKRLREWTRKQGGRVMESHLIGEEVPEAAGAGRVEGLPRRGGLLARPAGPGEAPRVRAGDLRHQR